MKHKKNSQKKFARNNQCWSILINRKCYEYFLLFENINSQIKSSSINYKTSLYFVAKNFSRILDTVRKVES